MGVLKRAHRSKFKLGFGNDRSKYWRMAKDLLGVPLATGLYTSILVLHTRLWYEEESLGTGDLLSNLNRKDC